MLRYFNKKYKSKVSMKIKITDIVAISQKAQDEIQRLKIEEEEKKASEEQKKLFKIEQKRKWKAELEKWSRKHFDSMLESALEGNCSINFSNINAYGKDYLELNGFHVFKLDLSDYQNKFEEEYSRLNILLDDFKAFFKKNPNLVNNSITSFDLEDLLKNIPKKIGIGDDVNFFHIRNSINNAHYRVDVLNSKTKKIDALKVKIRELDMTLYLLNQSFDTLLSIKNELANQKVNPFILLNGGEYFAISWAGGLAENNDVDHLFRNILTLQKIASPEGQNLLKYINEKIIENANKGLFEMTLKDESIFNVQKLNFRLNKDNLIKLLTHMGFKVKSIETGILINWNNSDISSAGC